VYQEVSAVAHARKDIEAGYAVDGTKIEDVLKPLSLVPAQVRHAALLEPPSIQVLKLTLSTLSAPFPKAYLDCPST
jgi:hypothetical protein